MGCDFGIADEALIPAALDKIEQALTPASPEQCEGWLVMLQAATAHRQDTGATSAVAYSLYASELRQWPADVAKAVCERLARGRPGQTDTNWFPTLAELVTACERAAANRKAIYASLQKWAPKPLPHANDRRFGEGPSEQEKAAVHRLAEEARIRLREAADRARPYRKGAEMPSTAGKPDEGGLTAEMRALMEKREEGNT